LPKVEELMVKYPLVKALYVNTADSPEIAAKVTVFTNPTVLFFVQGKEQFRFARSFGVGQIEDKIERVYGYFA